MLRKLVPAFFLILASCGESTPEPASTSAVESGPRMTPGEPVVDARDGRSYTTVLVGRQTWMTRNLAWDPHDATWSRVNPAIADSSRFYTWPSAMGGDTSLVNWCDVFKPARGVCPAGWHLPDTSEWMELARSLGGMEAAGQFLKSTDGWLPPQTEDGTSSSNFFQARPYGYWTRGDQGFGWYGHTPPDSAFLEAGTRAAFWTRSNRVDFSCTSAWGTFLSAQDRGLRLLLIPRATALNVRCLKDST